MIICQNGILRIRQMICSSTAERSSRLQERNISLLNSIRQDLKMLQGMTTFTQRSVRQRFPSALMMSFFFSNAPMSIIANSVPCRLKRSVIFMIMPSFCGRRPILCGLYSSAEENTRKRLCTRESPDHILRRRDENAAFLQVHGSFTVSGMV